MTIICSINWGDVGTWFSGIITLGALLFAFYQLHSDRKLQARSEKIFLAEHISAWVEDEGETKATVAILNSSKFPVYKVIAKLVRTGLELSNSIELHLMDYVCFVSVLPPGKYYREIPSDYRGMNFKPGMEIAFTDARGHSWIRGSDGQIKELNQLPSEYYGLDEPLSWYLPGKRYDI